MNRNKYAKLFFLILISFCVDGCKKKLVDNKSIIISYVDNHDESSFDKENGLFIYYKNAKADKESYLMSGFFSQGFRTSNWTYKVNNDLKTVSWAYYKDKYVDIETNVFKSVDTCIYGDNFSVLKFHTGNEKIKLVFALESEIIKKISQNNYPELLSRQFQEIGYKVEKIDEVNICDKNCITTYSVLIKKDSQSLFLYTGYLTLKNGKTFDFTIQTSLKNSFYARILFDAVLTNTIVYKQRIYSPW